MNTPTFRTSLAAAVVGLIALPLTAELRVAHLGVLPGASFSQAWAINDHGEIAGSSGLAEGVDQHAVLWRDGEWVDLGALPGHAYSLATDINKRGVVTGASRSTVTDTTAVLWDRGAIIELGTLPGGGYSSADAINDKEVVAGVATSASGQVHLVRWDNRQIEDLGPLTGGGFVTGINRGGVIVGRSERPAGTRGFVWSAGEFTELPPLAGNFSAAHDINARGWVVGYSSTGSGAHRATLWRDGVASDLGALPGGTLSVATSINDRGQIVGWGYNAASETRAILWDNGMVIDLGTLPGGDTSFAMDINNRGVIAGFSNAQEFLTRVQAALWFEVRGR